MSSNERAGLEKGVPRLHDLFLPPGIWEKFDYIEYGRSKYSRVYVLHAYPVEVYVGWLDEIFVVGDVDLSVHIYSVHDRAAANDLTDKVVKIKSQYIHAQKTGNESRVYEMERQISDLEALRSAIQQRRDRIFESSVFICLHAGSKEELEEKSQILEDTFARLSAKLLPLVMRQVKGLKSVVPTGSPSVTDIVQILTSGGAASMLPVSNADISHQSGIFMGYNYFTNAPMFLNQFVGPPLLPNPHIACFGTSGSGKSVTLKLIVARSSLTGVRSVILDPEREYASLKGLLKEKYEHIRITPGKTSGINLLELEAEDDEDKQVVNITNKVVEIRALFSAIVENLDGRKLDPREAAALEESLREEYGAREITSDPRSLYEKGGKELPDGRFSVKPVKKEMPTLTDLHRRLEKKPGAENLVLMLKPFLRGGSLGMFDCLTEKKLNAPVVCFDVKDVEEEFSRFYAMFVLLVWTWQKFAQRDRKVRKQVVIDESWMFMKYGDAADFLEKLARRGRKYKTSLVVASQMIEEFLSREAGRAVIGNCATHILLKQAPTVLADVVEAFKLSPGVTKYLETFADGQCLVSLNGATTAVKVTPIPYEWPHVISSPPKEG